MNPWFAAFLSAICFAFMSLFVKLALTGGIPTLDLVFYRFLFGSLFFSIYFLGLKKDFKVISWKFTLLRAFTNILAVSLFYFAIGYLDLGTANLLNLTYPIFISILSPYILAERSSPWNYLAVALSSIGVALLLIGGEGVEYQRGIWIGLLCGLTSAFTLMSLKKARQFDDSVIIVCILMVVGTLVLSPLYSFELPMRADLWIWILSASFMALLGQMFITYSFRGLSSLQGSLMSSARILFSFLLGVVILSDPFRWEFLISFVLITYAIYLSKKKSV